jgi:cytochrome bd-type quinol oxidase subunit 2
MTKKIIYISLLLILLIVSLEVIPSMLSEADSFTNLLAIPVAGIVVYLFLTIFKKINKKQKS